MRRLEGRVAVVTGAASGIGRGLADRFAGEGMKLVLADIEEQPLARAATELEARGTAVVAVRTDVSRPEDVAALADRTLQAFGGVHVVCNNAGVATAGTLWETPLADWRWVVGVNLWGVVHGVRTFVPIMLERGEEGHIVNTASAAGLMAGQARLSIYAVTKHAVVALSEALDAELTQIGAKIKVSVLCPEFVRTRIAEAERNRPAEAGAPAEVTGPDAMFWSAVRQLVDTGISPADVADLVVRGIHDEKLYVLPHPSVRDNVSLRMQNVLSARSVSP